MWYETLTMEKGSRRKVASACDRCRRQKLKVRLPVHSLCIIALQTLLNLPDPTSAMSSIRVLYVHEQTLSVLHDRMTDGGIMRLQ